MSRSPPSSGGRRPGPAGSSSSSISACPFGYGEQAPFLGREDLRDPARRRPATTAAAPAPTRRRRSIRRASSGSAAPAESILASLDGGIELAGGTAGHVYLGNRIIRGWALELVLIVALVPVSRRRDRPLRPHAGGGACRCRAPGAPCGRGSASGSGSASWSGSERSPGCFPAGRRSRRRPTARRSPTGRSSGSWCSGLLARARLVARPPGSRCRSAPASDDEVLAGYAVALLALGAVGIATALISPYGLVFVVPSLYAWLWLPQVERAGRLGARPALRRRARRARARRRRDRHPARARARHAALPGVADDPRVHPVDDGSRAPRLGRGRSATRSARGGTLRAGAAACRPPRERP